MAESWTELPQALARGRARFEQWRRTRSERRIPESLWALAAKLAESNGVHATAKALRLNPQALREHLDAAARVADPGFVELPAVGLTGAPSWTMELVSPSGARLRIAGHGEAPPDVAALARDFVGHAR